MHKHHPGWHRPPHFFQGPPHWQPEQVQLRRRVFLRFAGLFGGLALLFLLSILIVLLLSQRLNLQATGTLLWVACGVPFAFLTLAVLLGGWAFRRIGSPIADVVAAADAVARGDLTVHLRQDIPGEFGQLTRSFNNMTAELARAEQQRRNLTADIAHELRTPLHIIQGQLEGMLDGVYEPSADHLTITLEETRLLARLVSDLQTLSLAESGQLPLHPIRLSAADLLSDVLTSFAGQAAELDIQLEIETAQEDTLLELYGDPQRLDQVLSNLVDNALRHTPAGGRIRLSAQAIPGGVRLEVQDNGPGIPLEDLPYVFDRFWRGDRSRSRNRGAGSGLGLAIAKQLVLAHGGQIRLESQPGQGARFTIDLPDHGDPAQSAVF